MASQQNPTYITRSDPPKGSPSSSMKPTLLAFHGSGSNATIHTVQLARLMRFIKPHFEIESLEAPFTCPAGPGILPFFDGCGPFKRWLPPSEQITLEVMRLGTSSAAMSPEVESLVRSTVLRIQASGGRVVGLIGFSQGTKVVAGLLRASEYRREKGIQDKATQWCDFDLALSVCASYPPPVFPSFLPEDEREKKKIATPTFHVQGKQDEWNWAGKGMIEKYYDIGEGKSKVIELEMGHHYPVAVEESEMIAEWMLATYKKAAERR